MSIVIKRGDTRNAIQATLRKNGDVVDLTGCDVFFYMSNGVNGYATVSDALNGKVLYPLETAAVDKTGFFTAEFKVKHADGRIETFPNEGYIDIQIKHDLGGI